MFLQPARAFMDYTVAGKICFCDQPQNVLRHSTQSCTNTFTFKTSKIHNGSKSITELHSFSKPVLYSVLCNIGTVSELP